MPNGINEREKFKQNRYPMRAVFKDLPVWDQRYLENAILASTWSKDPNRRVGAIAVSKEGVPGPACFNGFPRGIKDTPERLNNKELKNRLAVHAEVNATILHPGSVVGCTIYVTHQPCTPCASFLIQNKYSRIVTFDPELYSGMFDRWGEDFNLSLEVIEETGIELVLATTFPEGHERHGLPNRLQDSGCCEQPEQHAPIRVLPLYIHHDEKTSP